VNAYCVKCRAKRELAEPVAVFAANGTPATRGVCPICGTKLFRMGRTAAHAGLQAPEIRRPQTRKAGKPSAPDKRTGKLVIVESPAKAKTVGRFLGKEYTVRASIGHVRDLLRSKLSVDVEDEFKPQYRVPNEKRDIVKGLKKDASRAEAIYLATDPDREGEAIAWHLTEAAEFDPQRVRRVAFHEITRPAIEEAFSHPRGIDMDLVDAQQARRILDRLVGYNISPLLWAKVRSRLSAGRVQSAALRLVVDREREIDAFDPREYWSMDGEFIHADKPPAFRALLVAVDGSKPELGQRAEVDRLAVDLRAAKYAVTDVRRGTRIKRPPAPFTTSTLQQEASRRFGFTARKTMSVAQQLYEGVEIGDHDSTGLITYMRTDSTQVSAQAQAGARRVIEARYGREYLPDEAPEYRTRIRGAQEAHEAIRPTASDRIPEDIHAWLSADQLKLYRLIWQRFIASQMNPALFDTLVIDVQGDSADHHYGFRVAASSLRFAGFLEVYEERPEENGDGNGQNGENGKPEEARQSAMTQLPDLLPGDSLELLDLYPEQHFTQPPPRFSEATLVKALEENGIGRPSTYAPILTTIQQRGYVHREKRRLVPTEIGGVVNDLLVAHFPDIVDLGFTARMEEDLDEIADGQRAWVDVIGQFYEPFARQLKEAEEQMPEIKAEPEMLERKCPECGNPLMIRHGRFGKFIGCSNFPTCRFTEPWLEKIGVRCPEDGGELVERRTRRGRLFYGCANYPSCEFTSWKKPLPQPCPNCQGLLVAENHKHAECLACHSRFDRSELPIAEPDMA
jgi:DNA topoisomerase-1